MSYATMDDATLIEDLIEAADDLDELRAGEDGDELARRIRAGSRIDAGAAKRVLTALQRKRYFMLEERVAQALINTGQANPRVRRMHAQALIDQMKLEQAKACLEALVRDTEAEMNPAAVRAGVDELQSQVTVRVDAEEIRPILDKIQHRLVPDAENVEARGLLGRTFKQMYVTGAGGGDALRKALQAYHSVYARGKEHTWHGINVVALLRRAERDGVGVSGYDPPEVIAGEILAGIRAAGANIDIWQMATALEAFVALGRGDEAMEWAYGYAAHPGADAFELNSTLRQMNEVWQLDVSRERAAAVVPVLKDGLLRRQNGFFEVTPEQVRRGTVDLQGVHGADYFKTLVWYRNGLDRARSVARVSREDRSGGGTGFLIEGAELHPSLGRDLVLLTNAHVVHPEPQEPSTLHPQEVVIRFEALTEKIAAQRFRVREILWCSNSDNLDVSVLRLDAPPKCRPRIRPYRIAGTLPAVEQGKARVYIIGHPAERSLRFSIHDNHLLGRDAADTLLHYRTPTQPGSSGSPVFNSEWELIAIHHATWKEGVELTPLVRRSHQYSAANQGIALRAIRERMKASPPNKPYWRAS